MIRSLLLILGVGVPALWFTELGHDSAIYGVLLPLVSFASLIALGFWLVAFFHRAGVPQSGYTPGSGGGGGGGIGGGGGGC